MSVSPAAIDAYVMAAARLSFSRKRCAYARACT
jgi:hypothetical protein